MRFQYAVPRSGAIVCDYTFQQRLSLTTTLTPNGISATKMSFEGDGLDPQIKTIQPGGGVVMSLELAWGSLRRKLLRTFFPAYVQRMESVRQGSRGSLPFEPVDPRDLKYYRNQETYWWADADDRYRWRDAIPFARAGLAELLVIGGFFLLLTILFIWLWWPLSVAAGVVFCTGRMVFSETQCARFQRLWQRRVTGRW